MSTPTCWRARLCHNSETARLTPFTQGQMWSELPNERHMVSKNASTTQPAKLLVFFIVPHGAKLTTLLPSSTR